MSLPACAVPQPGALAPAVALHRRLRRRARQRRVQQQLARRRARCPKVLWRSQMQSGIARHLVRGHIASSETTWIQVLGVASLACLRRTTLYAVASLHGRWGRANGGTAPLAERVRVAHVECETFTEADAVDLLRPRALGLYAACSQSAALKSINTWVTGSPG